MTDSRQPPVANARLLAVHVCLRVIDDSQSLTQALEQELPRLAQERDRGFCADMCFGVCRFYHLLEAALKPLLNKPLKARDSDIQLILLLGMYQLRFMRVSTHAAVNETVKLASLRQKSWARGLVNAVLRNYARRLQTQNDASHKRLTDEEHAQAYPPWLREAIAQDWPQQADAIQLAGNQRPPMVIRIDTSQLSRNAYIQQLATAGIQSAAHAVVETALLLDTPAAVQQLPGFERGLVSVQDASAQLAAPLLGCQPGMRVLDACAAPGGKTLHLLQHSPRIELVALDRDAQRLQRVEQNLQRGNRSATLVCADAADTAGWHNGALFDRILLDAPCTASGIIRRHPDIRLLRKPTDIDGLQQQQARLLDVLWPLLKPGGRLVYSTCSLFKAENEDQIRRFTGSRSDCVEVPLNTVQWGLHRNHGRQILPGMDEMDGFYYACLDKR